MREIKFRAWDKKTKKMSDGFALFGEFTLLGAVHDWQSEMVNPAKRSLEALGDLEVMQFTGLKDRNGKEIYEYDILKSCDDGKNGMKFYYIVEWGHHAWSVRHYTLKRIHTVTSNYFFKGSRVIGNIHANPELLSSNNP